MKKVIITKTKPNGKELFFDADVYYPRNQSAIEKYVKKIINDFLQKGYKVPSKSNNADNIYNQMLKHKPEPYIAFFGPEALLIEIIVRDKDYKF